MLDRLVLLHSDWDFITAAIERLVAAKIPYAIVDAKFGGDDYQILVAENDEVKAGELLWKWGSSE